MWYLTERNNTFIVCSAVYINYCNDTLRVDLGCFEDPHQYVSGVSSALFLNSEQFGAKQKIYIFYIECF